ncbi:MAG: hypothetical protein GC160_28980 [Acidobacteria bacterium]|nr:hypothetical protein [Acidobacteriota bacterium]
MLRAAVSWKESESGLAETEAERLKEHVAAQDLDLSGNSPDDLELAAIGAAARSLYEIFSQWDPNDQTNKPIAYALASFIESKAHLLPKF